MIASFETVIADRETPPEVRLWRMVIASTIQEWVSGPLRTSQQAGQYLLSDKSDFKLVCQSAGMNHEFLRSRLLKLKARVTARPQITFSEYSGH
jgi:hypothetical protein